MPRAKTFKINRVFENLSKKKDDTLPLNVEYNVESAPSWQKEA